MKDDLGRFTLRPLAWIILACLTGLMVGSLHGMLRLETRYELTEFLAQNDPSIHEDKVLRNRYKVSESPWMMAILQRPSGWLDEASLRELGAATDQIETEKGVKSAISLGTLETVGRDAGTVRIGRLADVASPEQRTLLLRRSGLIKPALTSNDEAWASLLVELDTAGESDVLAVRDRLFSVLQSRFPNDTVRLAGVPIVQSEMTSQLKNEIVWLGGLSILAAVLALLILFSGYSALAIAGFNTIVCNIAVLGGLAWLGQHLGVLSMSLPILVAVQTLSLSIHSIIGYIEDRKHSPSHSSRTVLLSSCRRLLLPNLLVTLAVAIGFLTLAASEAKAMQDFGLTVAGASVALWSLSTLATFALMALLPEPQMRGWVSCRAVWMDKVLEHRRAVLGVVALLVLTSLATGLDVTLSHRLFDDMSAPNDRSSAVAVVDQKLGGLIPVELELRREHGSWLDPAERVQLQQLVASIRQLDVVGSVLSPLDLLSLAGVDFAAPSATSLSEVQALFELAPKNPLAGFLRDDGRSIRLSFRLKDRPSDEIQETLNAIESLAHVNAPKAQLRWGGWGAYVHRMNQALVNELLLGLWKALGVLFVMMIMIFRSLRWAVISVLPNLLPPLFLLAALAYLQIPIKPGLAVVFAVALGFAFNNTLYLLTRVRDIAAKTGGRITTAVIDSAFVHEAQPCLLSSLTLLIGFLMLSLSEFSVTRSFGMAMVFSMLAGIVGDLILLPALLRQWPDLLNPSPARPGVRLAPALTAGVLLLVVPAHANPLTLAEFAKESSRLLYAKDEVATLKMINVDPDGSEQTREIQIKRVTVGGGRQVQQKIVAKIVEPKTLKGTAILTTSDGTKQERWIYLPASKQVRRVVGGDESGAPILGSELSTEDLDLGQVDGATASIVSQDASTIKIESRIADKDSAYSRCLAVFDATSKLLKSAECFDKSGQPGKQVEVLGYRRLKGGVARPTEMKILNLKTKRYTRLVFENHKVGVGLRAGDFTPNALR